MSLEAQRSSSRRKTPSIVSFVSFWLRDRRRPARLSDRPPSFPSRPAAGPIPTSSSVAPEVALFPRVPFNSRFSLPYPSTANLNTLSDTSRLSHSTRLVVQNVLEVQNRLLLPQFLLKYLLCYMKNQEQYAPETGTASDFQEMSQNVTYDFGDGNVTLKSINMFRRTSLGPFFP
ncbi:hypothetical protein B0H16DRAFT_1687281 [Mycena metata]|uniref:Uncharacterized protein n=1 Tax=Mycena metata TaxID=1033252 RepID=A0AAD7JJ86_9AGAR|nr:hypothetical protein B0H16DRAFT_1687281 [Mycena metata]